MVDEKNMECRECKDKWGVLIPIREQWWQIEDKDNKKLVGEDAYLCKKCFAKMLLSQLIK